MASCTNEITIDERYAMCTGKGGLHRAPPLWNSRHSLRHTSMRGADPPDTALNYPPLSFGEHSPYSTVILEPTSTMYVEPHNE